MARCENCNKFVGLEMGDVEADDLECSDGNLTGSIRIVRNCADCGNELKEARFDLDESVDLSHNERPADFEHEVAVEANLEPLEESGGRYKKSYYGAFGHFSLRCTCEATLEVKWTDKLPASSMDDL